MSVNHTIPTDKGGQRAFNSLVSALLKTVRLPVVSTAIMWRKRAYDRAKLQDLEPYLLHDIGMSPAQRDREVRKPFWKR